MRSVVPRATDDDCHSESSLSVRPAPPGPEAHDVSAVMAWAASPPALCAVTVNRDEVAWCWPRAASGATPASRSSPPASAAGLAYIYPPPLFFVI